MENWPPKWMVVFHGKSLLKTDDLGGFTHYFWFNTHLYRSDFSGFPSMKNIQIFSQINVRCTAIRKCMEMCKKGCAKKSSKIQRCDMCKLWKPELQRKQLYSHGPPSAVHWAQHCNGPNHRHHAQGCLALHPSPDVLRIRIHIGNVGPELTMVFGGEIDEHWKNHWKNMEKSCFLPRIHTWCSATCCQYHSCGAPTKKEEKVRSSFSHGRVDNAPWDASCATWKVTNEPSQGNAIKAT